MVSPTLCVVFDLAMKAPALEPSQRVSRTTRSVEDGIPTEDRGNESMKSASLGSERGALAYLECGSLLPLF